MASKIINYSVLALFITVAFLLSAPAALAATATCTNGVTPTESGDWTVGNSTVCSDGNISVNAGSLIINTSGSLILDNVTLFMNSTVTSNLTINVTGTFAAVNGTNITTNDTANSFSLYYQSGSVGSINDSIIENLAAASGSNGLYIASSSVSLLNATIKDSKNYALYIVNANPSVTNSTIQDSPRGAYLSNSTSTLSGNTITRITTEDGIQVQASSTGVTLSLNTLHNITRYGVYANASTVSFTGNTVNNTTTAMYSEGSALTLIDSNITNAVTNTLFLNQTNITSINTTFNTTLVNVNASSTLTVQWYMDVYAYNTYGSFTVSGATITALLGNGSTSTEVTGTTTATGAATRVNVTEFVQTASGTANYNNYTINATKGDYTNSTNVNLTTSRFGANNVSVFVYEGRRSVALTSDVTNATKALQGYALFVLTINNTGNDWDVFTLTDNSSGSGFTLSYMNNSMNITNGSTNSVTMRVEIPSTAKLGTIYNFNITTTSTAVLGGTSNTSSVLINVTANATALKYGDITTNATTELNQNQSAENTWGSSNYTTAWVLWALNTTANFNFTIVNNTLTYFNTSQASSGFWTDGAYDNNVTTALVVLAHKLANIPNTGTDTANMTNAVAYLHSESNNTPAGNYTWPSAAPESYSTAVILTSIYKTGLNNANDTNATQWLILNQTNESDLRGSWNSNITQTAWALWAMNLAGNTSAEQYTKGLRYIWYNQSMDGYFGAGTNIEETAITAYILSQINANTTWTVDQDDNTSTTTDQYSGSLQRAVDWVVSQRNTTQGGWGFSPPSAYATALGVLSTGSTYATVSGQATGIGNATGWNNITGATITFTLGSSTHSATTNASGHYSINLPVNTTAYTATVSYANFYSNATPSVTLTAGSNATQDFYMLPGITLTGSYGADEFISGGTPQAESTAITITGQVTYNHTGAVLNGTGRTVSMTNDRSADEFTVPDLVINAGGNFTTSPTTPTVDTDTLYTLTFTATDGNSTQSTTQLLTVTNGGGSTDPPVVTPVAGGNGGGTPSNSLTFTQYDASLALTRGETKTIQVIVKNNGATALTNVGLSLIGIKSAWQEIKISSSTATTKDLSVGDSVTFDVKFTIPSDAEAKTYKGTWRAKDSGSVAIAEKAFSLKVSKVWTASTINALNASIKSLEDQTADLNKTIQKLKKSDVDITAFETTLVEISTNLASARTSLSTADYDNAETLKDNAETLLTDLNIRVEAATPSTSLAELLESGKSSLALVIAIVIGAGFVGFLLWFKFFRMIKIQEVIDKQKNFVAGGARVEGVIKSVTDTEKGKVFLVADGTNKLHVRYPYYTTVDKGDLIRASGSVRTYKDVPYMDATELHRVSVKHLG